MDLYVVKTVKKNTAFWKSEKLLHRVQIKKSNSEQIQSTHETEQSDGNNKLNITRGTQVFLSIWM